MNANEKSRFDALYQKLITTLKLRGHAPKTVEGYARAVRRLAESLDRCPVEVTRDELDTHFAKLLESHSWSTIKIDRNGLRFFYEYVLDQALPWIDLIKAPKTQRLPDVLSHQEIAQLIQTTRRFDYQCFWFVTYNMGLRLGESLHLAIGDIDGQAMRVHIRQGKGNKDRFVILPAPTLAVLRKLWRTHRHPRWLFPGQPAHDGAPARQVMDRGSIQKAFQRIVKECGIHKRASIHSLRHSYATHLIEVGLNLGAVQQQLGHAYPNTTARYVRITEKSTRDSRAMINDLIRTLAAVIRRTPAKPQEH